MAEPMPGRETTSGAAGPWLAWCGLLGFLGVAAGAFGAHGLREVLSERLLEVYQTAAHYHLVHALVLGLVAVLVLNGGGGPWPRRSGVCFVAGIIVFSGSLYLLSLTGIGWLGAITPLGGVLLLCGWFCLLLAGLKLRNRQTGHETEARGQ
jgi:uncharacterized membrane protein YgdD (TMEM256/DUF423 family)